MTRMFVALVPPEDVAEHLGEFLEPRLEAGRDDGLRWSVAEQWHVTLAFAAVVPDRALDDLLDGVARTAGRRPALEAAISGGGAFPHVAAARVLYAGLALGDSAASELERLASTVRDAVSHAGVEVDGQRFRPHLTLARLGRPADVVRWVRLLDAYRGPTWTVESLSVVASHLGEGPRRRPRHEVLAELPLAAGASSAQPEAGTASGESPRRSR